MARISITYTLIAIFLFAVHQSDAVITDTVCDPNSGGPAICTAADKNAECAAGTTKCACKTDFFLSSVKKTCAKKITTVTCTVGKTGNADCQTVDANSECKSGSTCTCKEGYKGTESCTKDITGNTCTPNDPSAGNTKCQALDSNAECSTSNCACKADYVLGTDKTKCLHKITTVTCDPAHATNGDTKCQQVDANSECKTGDTKCTCKKEYKGTDSCTKVLGGTCVNAGDCTVPVDNSACSTGKCECAANYIEERAVCKKALGQTCAKKDDCVSNAECDNKVCKCSAGFTKTNGLCAAESSATSAWMATSLLVTYLLSFLPRLI